MNLYLDTEFDGHGGPLISLAIAGDDGSHWYGVFSTDAKNEWVKVNVIPVLFRYEPNAFGDAEALRLSLVDYLNARKPLTIWADWPQDFELLLSLWRGREFGESYAPPCTLQLINTPIGEPQPVHPHNALSDAIALRLWHRTTKTVAA